MNHREWVAGIKVVDMQGFKALLLACTWNGFAWILYEGQEFPVTVLAATLKLV